MTVVFSRICNMSLTGSVVILFVLAVRLLLKKAPKIYSYTLWAVVLFRLLCPISLSAPVSVLEISAPAVSVSQGITSTVSYIPAPEPPAPMESIEPVETVRPEPERKPEPMEIAGAVWLLGMTVMALCSLVTYGKLCWNLREAVPFRKNIYLTDYVGVPFVLGLFRPRIYLPAGIPAEERRYIIAHERHHIRRGDHITKWLAYLALCLHWFNPLVWLAFVLAGKDMEMSCDEAVIRRLGPRIRADYSASLLRLSTGRKVIGGTPLSFGEGDPKGRIQNMARWKKPKLWISVTCILLCIVILVVCAVNPEGKEIKTLSRDSLASCEKVLTLMQSAENCYINVYGTTDGELSQGSPHERYWKHGEDWMQIKNTWDSVFAYLYRDGVYYDTVGTAGVENGHILWKVGTNRGNRKPWLLEFRWDEEKVELLERYKDEEGTHILLNIAEPITGADAAADSYTVEFTFHKDGSFSNVLLKASLKDPYGNIRNLEEIQFAGTQNEAWYAEQMEVAFRSRIQPLTSSIAGNTVTYGALSLTLPEGYSCMEGNGTGLLLLKNGEIAGGITHWVTPEDKDRNEWIPSLGLWDVISGASYWLTNWDKYFSASFINEFAPESLNHLHNFYIRDDLIYNLWADENIISREEESQLRKNIVFSDWIPEQQIQEAPPVAVSRIPGQYGCEAKENGFTITEGNQRIGGIDIYAIPGGSQTAFDPYFRWLENLGIPDYKDETLCYSGSSSPYGDWMMHFESDVPPGVPQTVNRHHTFFVNTTQVYDVWFDLMATNNTTKDAILSALTGQEAQNADTVPDINYRDTYYSLDGSVTFNIQAVAQPPETAALSAEILEHCIKTEFQSTNLDGYGLDTTSTGHVGAKCEVNVTKMSAGEYVLAGQNKPIPTLEVYGVRTYIFANGDRLGQEQGEIHLMTLNALDGSVLMSFGRKEEALPQLTEQEALDKCAAVLESVQSGSYHIYVEDIRQYSDTTGTNHMATEYFRNGQNWLRIAYVHAMDSVEKHASMSVDGKMFHNQGNWSSEELIWKEGDAGGTQMPWLAEYRLQEEDLEYVYQRWSNNQLVINLRIEKPYPEHPVQSDHYFTDFYFENGETFVKVELQSPEIRWENGIQSYASKTEQVLSLDASKIQERIYTEYSKTSS